MIENLKKRKQRQYLSEITKLEKLKGCFLMQKPRMRNKGDCYDFL